MSETIILTPEGRAKLEAEIKELVEIKRPEILDRIKQARELGDLRENAEYHQAKEDQAFMEGRIMEIETTLKTAQNVSSSGTKNKSQEVTIGSNVEVSVNGEIKKYTIVGSTEANPTQALISCDSPLGQALLGAKLNQEVTVDTPKGSAIYLIKTIN